MSISGVSSIRHETQKSNNESDNCEYITINWVTLKWKEKKQYSAEKLNTDYIQHH